MGRPEIALREGLVRFYIRDGDRPCGELAFALMDPRHEIINNNIDPGEFLTKKGILRGHIAKVLDVKPMRIRRVLVDSGVWLHQEEWGQRLGRRAMKRFLEEWSDIADLVIVSAGQLNIGHGPMEDKLIRIWSEVGFTLDPRSSFNRMYYLPEHKRNG